MPPTPYMAPPDLPDGNGVVQTIMGGDEDVKASKGQTSAHDAPVSMTPGATSSSDTHLHFPVNTAKDLPRTNSFRSMEDTLDVDRFNELIDLDKVVRSGIVQKKSFGHLGQWNDREFYLNTDNVSLSRISKQRAFDVIFFDEIAAILIGAETSSPIVRSQLLPDKTRPAAAGKRRGRRRIEKSRSMIIDSGNKVGHSLGQMGVTNLANQNSSSHFDVNCYFDLCTTPDSKHAGRILNFRADTPQDCASWVHDIKQTMKDREERGLKTTSWTPLFRLHAKIRRLYEREASQIGFMLLIFIAFLVNTLDSELQPIFNQKDSHKGHQKDNSLIAALFMLDVVFTSLFSIELLMHIVSLEAWIATSRRVFLNSICSGWLFLDMLVVGASWANIVLDGQLGGGAITALRMARMLRCLRILRIFKSFATLRLIVSALGASLGPVTNTFAVLIVTTAVFSIIGVGLFSELENEFGERYDEFSKFSSAFFTMFQCLTADAWASEVARPMFSNSGPWQLRDFTIAIYFILYMLIAYLVVMNLILAVLIDEFLKAADQKREEKNTVNQQGAARSFLFGPIDPVLEQLAHLYTNDELNAKIDKLFEFVRNDADLVDFGSLRGGFELLSAIENGTAGVQMTSSLESSPSLPRNLPCIRITEEDFREMTGDGLLCSPDGTMTKAQFDQMIRMQIKLYVQRQASCALVGEGAGGGKHVTVFQLKYIVTALDELLQKQNLANKIMLMGGKKKVGATFSRTPSWAMELNSGELEELARMPVVRTDSSGSIIDTPGNNVLPGQVENSSVSQNDCLFSYSPKQTLSPMKSACVRTRDELDYDKKLMSLEERMQGQFATLSKKVESVDDRMQQNFDRILHLLDAEKNRDSHDSSSQAPSVSHNELWVSQMTVPGHQSERLRAKPEVLTKLQDTPVEKLDLVDVAEVNETDVKP